MTEGTDMDHISLGNPVFAAYAVAAALMVLKTIAMAWLTVVRMVQVKGGYRAPEDERRTPFNPDPRPGQAGPDERVDRMRRIHQNDLENVPAFLAAGFLFVLTDPALWVAQVLFYGYVLSRLLHFWAYATAKNHEVRATFWTIGVVMVMGMAVWVLIRALAA
jgi:glutathione S-transferase